MIHWILTSFLPAFIGGIMGGIFEIRYQAWRNRIMAKRGL